MDDGHEKKAPSGIPANAPLSAERVRMAIDNPETRRDVHIRLTISGGLPGDATPFTLDVDGQGQVALALHDAAGALQEGRSAQVGEETVIRLVGELGRAALAAAAARPARIPPDSLVGRLEISIAGDGQQIVFMADPEQAKTAGFNLPPQVEQVIDELMRIGRGAAEDGQALGGENLQI